MSITESAEHHREPGEYLDPGIAMVMTAMLDEVLAVAIKAKMRDLSAKLHKRLFEGYGPLSSFAAKIDMAYALSIVDDKTFRDLRIIKDIRNKFAHSSDFIHFNSPKVLALFKQFSEWNRESQPSDIFLHQCRSCLNSMKAVIERFRLAKALIGGESNPQ